MLNIYKNSNKNNNNIISHSKIVLINITLISTIAECESEYNNRSHACHYNRVSIFTDTICKPINASAK